MDVVSQDTDLLEQITNQELLQKLCQAINTVLTEQERQVICMRYGLGSRSVSKQRQVAASLGISRSYVSRIEKKALEKLKDALS